MNFSVPVLENNSSQHFVPQNLSLVNPSSNNFCTPYVFNRLNRAMNFSSPQSPVSFYPQQSYIRPVSLILTDECFKSNILFSGNPNESIVEFLDKFEEMSKHFPDINDEDMARALQNLLLDKAKWFSSIRKSEFNKFSNAKLVLLDRFQSRTDDVELMKKLSLRKQMSEEPLEHFLYETSQINKRMSKPLSETEFVKAIKGNLQQPYLRKAFNQNLTTIKELVSVEKHEEDTRNHFVNLDRRQRSFMNPPLPPSLFLSDEVNINQSSVECLPPVKPEEPSLPKPPDNPPSSQKCSKPNKPSKPYPRVPGKDRNFRVKMISPPVCLNCGNPSHQRSDCPNPKILRCYDCGKLGTTRLYCPNVHKRNKCRKFLARSRLCQRISSSVKIPF